MVGYFSYSNWARGRVKKMQQNILPVTPSGHINMFPKLGVGKMRKVVLQSRQQNKAVLLSEQRMTVFLSGYYETKADNACERKRQEKVLQRKHRK
jgi:hypothetical protein